MKDILYKIKRKCLNVLPDKTYLKIRYRHKFKRKLDLKNPKTYNEKLQWLKLYDRNPMYCKLVDKYEVRKFIKEKIGHEYLIPLIKVYNNVEEIDFDELPNQFVLKCTHDSGGIIICKDKKQLDIEKAKEKLKKSLSVNYYYNGREWPYKNVKPRIIAEEYLEEKKYGELRDYKFFVFSGNVKLMFIASNRQGKGDTYFDFFDNNFKHLNIINGHPNAPSCPDKPNNFKKMIKLSEKIAENLLHTRIDFYEIDGKIYFGEITLYHWSGLMPFEPQEWDRKLGEMLELPSKKRSY